MEKRHCRAKQITKDLSLGVHLFPLSLPTAQVSWLRQHAGSSLWRWLLCAWVTAANMQCTEYSAYLAPSDALWTQEVKEQHHVLDLVQLPGLHNSEVSEPGPSPPLLPPRTTATLPSKQWGDSWSFKIFLFFNGLYIFRAILNSQRNCTWTADFACTPSLHGIGVLCF